MASTVGLVARSLTSLGEVQDRLRTWTNNQCLEQFVYETVSVEESTKIGILVSSAASNSTVLFTSSVPTSLSRTYLPLVCLPLAFLPTVHRKDAKSTLGLSFLTNLPPAIHKNTIVVAVTHRNID